MRLYINQNLIDLHEKEGVNYTKQVNTLKKDLSTRQSNFSMDIEVPKTAKNMKSFEGLSIVGSTSSLPYQKNTARLFVGNLCVIFKGWAMFLSENEKSFSIVLYDGHIHFMKQLDNVTFNDIDLAEITHTKDIPTIKENWEVGNEFFKYLLADFNGKTHFTESTVNYINADYLIPSVSVKYLWEKIFSHLGFTFSGTIFQDEEFLNLFLTFPKGLTAGEDGAVAFSLTFPDQEIMLYSTGYNWSPFRPSFYEGLTYEVTSGEIISNSTNEKEKLWKAPVTGEYRIKMTGSLTNNSSKTSFLYLGKNLHNTHTNDNWNSEPLEEIFNPPRPIATALQKTTPIDIDEVVYLYAGDTLSLFYYRNQMYWDYTTLQLEWQMIKVNKTVIDQLEFFKNLTPKDFYKEILWRFGLTPFPVKDRNHIDFLTYDEHINGQVEDWSSKFVRKISSEFGGMDDYAKVNYFRFRYNDEENDFNDGFFQIDNANLSEKTDVITSKTYSVKEYPVEFAVGSQLETVPKIELWEKDPKEQDGQTIIEYIPRDSRFTFVREREIDSPASIGSEELQSYAEAAKVRAVDTFDYSWQRIVNVRYRAINSLFRNSLFVKAEFHLSEAEFDECDLRKPIYVKQLGGNFLINLIEKPDLRKSRTEVELIKINK